MSKGHLVNLPKKYRPRSTYVAGAGWSVSKHCFGQITVRPGTIRLSHNSVRQNPVIDPELYDSLHGFSIHHEALFSESVSRI